MKSLITLREQEILQLMAQGKSSKNIANELGVSFHTIQTHRKNILRKLNENSTIRAVTVATTVGLIPINKINVSFYSNTEQS
ncbi:MAG: LuxR C-terminal-related transcriptional regulator [Cyclobacteriaceae bacterium]|nr:LuxR C-terminal-related transcriptional regulator [Cyclobacteriaceae bacterium]